MANMGSAVKIDIQDVFKRFTVKVTVSGISRAIWRIKIGTWIMALGSAIAGFDLEVK